MEDHSTYTEQITLDEGDVDYRGLMRPSALLRCAEHMATAHAWGLGMDKAFYSARQMVYLVGRQAFQFYRAPAMRETVTLTTYPEKTHRGANKRVLVVRSLDGEELARVDTRWTLVDTCAGKIIRHIPPEPAHPAGDRPVLERHGGLGAVFAGAESGRAGQRRLPAGGLLHL